MSLLKLSLPMMLAASFVLVAGTSQAQTRTTHHSNHSGMNQGGGTSPMQNSIQAAQNQARSIANQQHAVWVAHRRAKAAKEAAAKAAGTKTTPTTTSNKTSTAKNTPPATK